MDKFILGIDPSTSSTGYALYSLEQDIIIDYGVIKSKADSPVEFANMYVALMDVFSSYNIVFVGCETQFIGVNKDTGIKTIRPTGVVLATSGMNGISDKQFKFFYPSSWRKLYHKGTLYEAQNKKKDTYSLVQLQYPQFNFTNFTKYNDITDSIGIAHASAIYYKNELHS